jgi:hypothetical protein
MTHNEGGVLVVRHLIDFVCLFDGDWLRKPKDPEKFTDLHIIEEQCNDLYHINKTELNNIIMQIK